MLALKARCMDEGDSMMGADEVAGLKDGRLPVRTVFPLGALPSKLLNACAVQHSFARQLPPRSSLDSSVRGLCAARHLLRSLPG